MRRPGCKTYNIIEHEPALGKVTECVVEIPDEEVREAIVAILEENDPCEIDTRIGFEPNNNYELGLTLGEFMTDDDLRRLCIKMQEELIDDDYGMDKHYDVIFNFVEDLEQDMSYETVIQDFHR